MELLLPVKSHHCRTTHSACECMLDDYFKLKAEVERLLKELDRQGRVLAERDDEIEELAEQRDLARAEVERLRGELEQLKAAISHPARCTCKACWALAKEMDGGGEGK